MSWTICDGQVHPLTYRKKARALAILIDDVTGIKDSEQSTMSIVFRRPGLESAYNYMQELKP